MAAITPALMPIRTMRMMAATASCMVAPNRLRNTSLTGRRRR